MRDEHVNHTWQPTVLVNELYLELTRIKSIPPVSPGDAKERDAFFGLAAFLMKRLLARHAQRLPQRVTKAELDEAFAVVVSGEQALREVEELLAQLGAVDPKLRLVVKMKALEGLSGEDRPTSGLFRANSGPPMGFRAVLAARSDDLQATLMTREQSQAAWDLLQSMSSLSPEELRSSLDAPTGDPEVWEVVTAVLWRSGKVDTRPRRPKDRPLRGDPAPGQGRHGRGVCRA
jgi:hypothetical protein